jgi:hypothetical protein
VTISTFDNPLQGGEIDMRINLCVFENRLRCECGQPVHSSDFRDESSGALGVCSKCHKDTMAIRVDGGDNDED